MSTAFATLQQMASRRTVAPGERCDLCGSPVAERHRHLIDPKSRRLICACEACSLLFPGTDTKYRRVPEQARLLTDFQLSEGDWSSMLIPINLAFFMKSSADGRVIALYPSPAGATESLLSLEAWETIKANNPVLAGMQADVEALLANRLGEPEYFIAPVDRCYELTGLIRSNWRGFSGGEEMWRAVREFLADLKECCRA